ncbi:alpha/beta fold hydrolase [Streptomyces sp. CA-250714]|uniref:alpha/beta fold hydrolase n=1 Tax=Streptomyces sp. CA-250714 TaxID=3240060 RepID=UPI003D8D9378
MLFSPGAATSRSLGFGAGVVDGLGVRLIALDRPGLGASTPAPGRTFADFAADIAAFARARGLDRPAMVGNSQGAPFALAFPQPPAGRCPQRTGWSGRWRWSPARTRWPTPGSPSRRSPRCCPPSCTASRSWPPANPRRRTRSSPASRHRRCGRWCSPPARPATARSTSAPTSPPPTAGLWRRRSRRAPTATHVTRCSPWAAGTSIWRRSGCRSTSGTATRTSATRPTREQGWRRGCPARNGICCPGWAAHCCGRTPRPYCPSSPGVDRTTLGYRQVPDGIGAPLGL